VTGGFRTFCSGRDVTENFLSAPLSHHDIILGESWLKANSGIIDYAHGRLWCQWTPTGIQRMSFDALPLTGPDQTRETSNWPTQDTDTLDPLYSIVCRAIREGVKQASPPMWFLLPTDQFHRLQPVITLAVLTSTPVSDIGSTANRPMGSRGRRLEAQVHQDLSCQGILVRSYLKTLTWWICLILRY